MRLFSTNQFVRLVWIWIYLSSYEGVSLPNEDAQHAGLSHVIPAVATHHHTTLDCDPDCTGKNGLCTPEDKDRLGLESIKALHRQIDDDNDGNVELSESDEFLREELQYQGNFDRHSKFHNQDKQITVDELWKAWKHSEVYNWTNDNVIEWLTDSIQLPQYVPIFTKRAIDGPLLPRVAANLNQYLSSVLGIKDLRHKQRVSLKAMDAVLFGPPKAPHNYMKDVSLIASLVLAIGGLLYAYLQRKISVKQEREFYQTLENMRHKESKLIEMQKKMGDMINDQESVVQEKVKLQSEIERVKTEIEGAKDEADRLKKQREHTDESSIQKLQLAVEELTQVRVALKRAEKQLEETNAWTAPEFRRLLKETHDIEQKHFIERKKAADLQLERAKVAIDRLKDKGKNIFKTIITAHGQTMDDLDLMLSEAKACMECLSRDYRNSQQRWAKIQAYCGFNNVSMRPSFDLGGPEDKISSGIIVPNAIGAMVPLPENGTESEPTTAATTIASALSGTSSAAHMHDFHKMTEKGVTLPVSRTMNEMRYDAVAPGAGGVTAEQFVRPVASASEAVSSGLSASLTRRQTTTGRLEEERHVPAELVLGASFDSMRMMPAQSQSQSESDLSQNGGGAGNRLPSMKSSTSSSRPSDNEHHPSNEQLSNDDDDDGSGDSKDSGNVSIATGNGGQGQGNGAANAKTKRKGFFSWKKSKEKKN